MINKRNPNIIIFTLLLSAFIVQGNDLILPPNLGSLSETFSQFSYATITLIATVSTISLAIASFVSPKIAFCIGKKRLLLIGSVLFTVFGTLVSFSNSFLFILILRLLTGLGAGFTVTASMMLIPELFPDQEQVNKVMGMNTVSMSAWGMILSLLSGWLGIISWRTANLLCLLTLIVIIFQLFFVPNDKDVGDHSHDNTKQNLLPSKAILEIGIVTFIYAAFSTMYLTGIASFIIQANLGDSAMAGTATAIFTIGAFITGVLFSRITSGIGVNYTAALSFAFLAAGIFFFPFFTPSLVTVFIGSFIYGMGYSIFYAFFLAEAVRVSETEHRDINISVATGLFFLGYFASSFIMEVISKIFQNISMAFVFQSMGVVFILFVIYYLSKQFYSMRSSNKKVTQTLE